MKTGRNDPCPCGSGKKYKKCCLPKDREVKASYIPPESSADDSPAAFRQETPTALADAVDWPKPRAAAFVTPQPDPPRDPRIEAINARWAEFKSADYPGRIGVFVKTLHEPELMDPEIAFEMLNTLWHETARRGERDQFDILVRALRERLPDICRENQHYFLSMLIDNALFAGRQHDLEALAVESAATAAEHFDTFHSFLDQLAWHGQLELLTRTMKAAWPCVKESAEIFQWAIDDFAVHAASYEALALAQRKEQDAADASLKERLTPYRDSIIVEHFQEFVELCTGARMAEWLPSDSDPSGLGKKLGKQASAQRRDAVRRRLTQLTVEFLGYVQREEEIPLSRAELGRGELLRYLMDRAECDLPPRGSMIDRMMDPERFREPPKPTNPAYRLTPDHETLDRSLGRRFDVFDRRPHLAAAAYEIIPAWLRFLVRRELITEDQRIASHANAGRLLDALLKFYESSIEYVSIAPALRRAWVRRETPEYNRGVAADAP